MHPQRHGSQLERSHVHLFVEEGAAGLSLPICLPAAARARVFELALFALGFADRHPEWSEAARCQLEQGTGLDRVRWRKWPPQGTPSARCVHGLFTLARQAELGGCAWQVLKLEAADPRAGVAAPTNLTMNQTLEGHQVSPRTTLWNLSRASFCSLCGLAFIGRCGVRCLE